MDMKKRSRWMCTGKYFIANKSLPSVLINIFQIEELLNFKVNLLFH
jgi:hypothetical protein